MGPHRKRGSQIYNSAHASVGKGKTVLTLPAPPYNNNTHHFVFRFPPEATSRKPMHTTVCDIRRRDITRKGSTDFFSTDIFGGATNALAWTHVQKSPLACIDMHPVLPLSTAYFDVTIRLSSTRGVFACVCTAAVRIAWHQLGV